MAVWLIAVAEARPALDLVAPTGLRSRGGTQQHAPRLCAPRRRGHQRFRSAHAPVTGGGGSARSATHREQTGVHAPTCGPPCAPRRRHLPAPNGSARRHATTPGLGVRRGRDRGREAEQHSGWRRGPSGAAGGRLGGFVPAGHGRPPVNRSRRDRRSGEPAPNTRKSSCTCGASWRSQMPRASHYRRIAPWPRI